MSMKTFDESKHPRAAAGRFAKKTNDAPRSTLTGTAPTPGIGSHHGNDVGRTKRMSESLARAADELRNKGRDEEAAMLDSHREQNADERYWDSVAAAKGLTLEEREDLAAHTGAPGFWENVTTSTTSNRVIADALKPRMLATVREREEKLQEIAEKVDAPIELSSSGHAYITGSTSSYRYTMRQDEGGQTFSVNGYQFHSALDIPARNIKARALAEKFLRERESIAELVSLHARVTEMYQRWRSFATAD